MLKDSLSLTRLFIRIYWMAITIWCLIQVTLIAVLRHDTIVTTTAIDQIPPAPSDAELTLLAGLFALSYMTLVIFLGRAFSSGQRTNWLRQMPFRALSLNLLPMFILLGYGTCLLFFIPWGAFSAGVSVGVLGIPIALFLIIKNSRHILVGLLQSAVAGVGLLFFWTYLFFDWSLLAPQFTVEATALVVFTATWLTLGSRERSYTLAPAFTLLCLLIGVAAYHEIRVPENFSQAVLDHSFRPTEKTLNWFKKIALESDYWKDSEQFRLPSYVNYRAQEFAQTLNDDERVRYVDNIDANNKQWQDTRLSNFRPLRLQLIWLPEDRILTYGRIPVKRDIATAKVEEYLYSHWHDSKVYCAVLPPRKTSRFLEKFFMVDDCSQTVTVQQAWAFYSLTDPGNFEKEFDQYLLTATEKSGIHTRQILSYWLISSWLLPDQYAPHRGKLFETEPLTPQMLEQMKQDHAREPLKCLKHQPRDRDGFLQAFKSGNLENESCKRLYFLLSLAVLGDTNSLYNKLTSEPISLAEAWRRRLADPFFQRAWFNDWTWKEILKSENWPKIERLFEYVDRRPDL